MIPAIRYDNPKMLTEKHNDEKLVITLLIGWGEGNGGEGEGGGASLITYHFW